MIFRARATRGRGLPSLDAHSGRSISPHPLLCHAGSSVLGEDERVAFARPGATLRIASRAFSLPPIALSAIYEQWKMPV